MKISGLGIESMDVGAPVGNQNARRAKEFRLALKRALARKANSKASDALEEIAFGLVEAAYGREMWAIKEVADRIDGRPAQAIIGDSDEDPINVVSRIERVIRNADSSD